jgi:hypothetical protein
MALRFFVVRRNEQTQTEGKLQLLSSGETLESVQDELVKSASSDYANEIILLEVRDYKLKTEVVIEGE